MRRCSDDGDDGDGGAVSRKFGKRLVGERVGGCGCGRNGCAGWMLLGRRDVGLVVVMTTRRSGGVGVGVCCPVGMGTRGMGTSTWCLFSSLFFSSSKPHRGAAAAQSNSDSDSVAAAMSNTAAAARRVLRLRLRLSLRPPHVLDTVIQSPVADLCAISSSSSPCSSPYSTANNSSSRSSPNCPPSSRPWPSPDSHNRRRRSVSSRCCLAHHHHNSSFRRSSRAMHSRRTARRWCERQQGARGGGWRAG
ncbi:hypothetical protein IWZ03DRAFT_86815 [Phyllosticta citriasiana]|uniref:Uncharacterized protein n=1 Tax=Phyllosticta citriasiana TaxID=595635 RepID=A0ABR1K8C2_9PEZI